MVFHPTHARNRKMFEYLKTIVLVLFLSIQFTCIAQDEQSLSFTGQASTWAGLNDEKLVWTGVRYIPQLNYKIQKKKNLIDFEASANINSALNFFDFDSLSGDANLKPYRFWARYSGEQIELRLGLQKINFGSASMLRPLMWFDQVDPRDPLQLTDGVWALLGRYYFLNNANLWLWVLYPSDKPKTWELIKSNGSFPEFGGRFQQPLKKGEIAISFHQRIADSRENAFELPVFDEILENRLGLDGKWDLGVGLWFEAAYIHKNKDLQLATNQLLANIGADYTFGLGNGLHVMVEQLAVTTGRKRIDLANGFAFSGLTISYPFSMFDNLNAIVYYDWSSSNTYNFISFQHKFNKIDMHLMGWWNPKQYLIPNQTASGNMFAGNGFQLMLVYNH